MDNNRSLKSLLESSSSPPHDSSGEEEAYNSFNDETFGSRMELWEQGASFEPSDSPPAVASGEGRPASASSRAKMGPESAAVVVKEVVSSPSASSDDLTAAGGGGGVPIAAARRRTLITSSDEPGATAVTSASTPEADRDAMTYLIHSTLSHLGLGLTQQKHGPGGAGGGNAASAAATANGAIAGGAGGGVAAPVASSSSSSSAGGTSVVEAVGKASSFIAATSGRTNDTAGLQPATPANNGGDIESELDTFCHSSTAVAAATADCDPNWNSTPKKPPTDEGFHHRERVTPPTATSTATATRACLQHQASPPQQQQQQQRPEPGEMDSEEATFEPRGSFHHHHQQQQQQQTPVETRSKQFDRVAAITGGLSSSPPITPRRSSLGQLDGSGSRCFERTAPASVSSGGGIERYSNNNSNNSSSNNNTSNNTSNNNNSNNNSSNNNTTNIKSGLSGARLENFDLRNIETFGLDAVQQHIHDHNSTGNIGSVHAGGVSNNNNNNNNNSNTISGGGGDNSCNNGSAQFGKGTPLTASGPGEQHTSTVSAKVSRNFHRFEDDGLSNAPPGFVSERDGRARVPEIRDPRMYDFYMEMCQEMEQEQATQRLGNLALESPMTEMKHKVWAQIELVVDLGPIVEVMEDVMDRLVDPTDPPSPPERHELLQNLADALQPENICNLVRLVHARRLLMHSLTYMWSETLLREHVLKLLAAMLRHLNTLLVSDGSDMVFGRKRHVFANIFAGCSMDQLAGLTMCLLRAPAMAVESKLGLYFIGRLLENAERLVDVGTTPNWVEKCLPKIVHHLSQVKRGDIVRELVGTVALRHITKHMDRISVLRAFNASSVTSPNGASF